MLAPIVRISLANPRVVTALAILITVLGAAALAGVRFDVFPDFAPPLVLLLVMPRDWRGALAIPGVKSIAEQIGRAENGQDPDAPHKSEFEVRIDPQDHEPPASCATQ